MQFQNQFGTFLEAGGKMQNYRILILSIFIPMLLEAAPFCVVLSTGKNCWYYDANDCRSAALRNGGICVVNEEPSIQEKSLQESQAQKSGSTYKPIGQSMVSPEEMQRNFDRYNEDERARAHQQHLQKGLDGMNETFSGLPKEVQNQVLLEVGGPASFAASDEKRAAWYKGVNVVIAKYNDGLKTNAHKDEPSGEQLELNEENVSVYKMALEYSKQTLSDPDATEAQKSKARATIKKYEKPVADYLKASK